MKRILLFQTSISNSATLSESYMSTFNPAAYARVFGRAMPNSCTSSNNGQGAGAGGGCSGNYDPFRCCDPDGSDQGYMYLYATVNGVEEVEQKDEFKVR